MIEEDGKCTRKIFDKAFFFFRNDSLQEQVVCVTQHKMFPTFIGSSAGDSDVSVRVAVAGDIPEENIVSNNF